MLFCVSAPARHYGMEAIDVVVGIDRPQHALGVDVLGQWQLNQDAVDRGVG